METKVCKTCERELPLDSFHKSKNCKSGVKNECKECVSLYMKRYGDRKKKEKSEGGLLKVYSNPELSRFTPRQLMDELAARGYKGELSMTIVKTAKIGT